MPPATAFVENALLYLRCPAGYQPPPYLAHQRLLPLPHFTWLVCASLYAN